MVRGIFIILLFYLLGECVSYGIGRVIPGNVCGMLLLFLSLMLGWVNPQHVKSVATTLTRNMALFFVPVSVGILASYKLLAENLVALFSVCIVTTVIVLATVGHLQQFLEKRWKK